MRSIHQIMKCREGFGGLFPLEHPPGRRASFLLLSMIPIYFILAGLLLQPAEEIIPGILHIIREPDFLITDYFVIGGPGAAMINAGALTLMSIGMIYFLGMEMTGHTITSSLLMFGFSLFGKNLMNIWAILGGVCLYAFYHRTSLRRYIYVGLYGTSLSPIITQMMDVGPHPWEVRLVIAVAVGLAIGFVLPPLCTHVHYAHQGYSLYNVGFGAGIIATVVVSLLKSFGVTVESRLIWSTAYSRVCAGLLSVLFLGMIALAFLIRGRAVWESYVRILKTTGISGTDYLKDEGGAAVLLNMGINGLFSMGAVLLAGGALNGPTICGIFTVVGFSSTGKHLKNIVPIMAGVWLASLTKIWSLNDPSPLITLLFSTTLAPVAGRFGPIAGIIAGYLHSSVALNVGIVYGGMNLYNNGYAGGIVAIFMVPVMQSIQDRRAKAKGRISL